MSGCRNPAMWSDTCSIKPYPAANDLEAPEALAQEIALNCSFRSLWMLRLKFRMDPSWRRSKVKISNNMIGWWGQAIH